MKKFWLLTGVLVFLVALCIPNSWATIFNLSDDNSTATIDTESSLGMDTWTVDGIDHLYEQWFYYRVGDAGPENSVSALSITFENAFNTNADPDLDTLSVTYEAVDGSFNIEISFILRGGSPGSNSSDVTEVIDINNTSGSSLDFHFFQYTDFDIGGSSGDFVTLSGGNTFRQWDPLFVASETVTTPMPDAWEADYFSVTRTKLQNAVPDNLTNATSPLGPGDVTWAWQWDVTIANNGSFQISKDKNIAPNVPEPGMLLLLGSGLIGLGGYARLRRKKS
jgi:hypothetical protein